MKTCRRGHDLAVVGTRADGFCRECARTHGRRGTRKYRGMGEHPEDPPAGTPCRLCNRVPAHRLRADHDHSTGRFRGWLCNRCNLRLAALDDRVWFAQAQMYLKEGTK